MLDRLDLEHFRTYERRTFELAPTTVILGPNGAGKTNVLEAISMLSLTTSWRTERDSEVVAWGQPFCRISGADEELVIQVSPYMKRLKIDGVSKRTYQVIGHFPTVLFQPDDIQILYGAPAARRHYVDRIISQTSMAYTRAILELQAVLKQRNRLLKNIGEGLASEAELPFWDQELGKLHEVIHGERATYLEFFNERLPALFSQMVPEVPVVSVEYHMSPRHIEGTFASYVAGQRHKEIAAGSSLYGPHREDLIFRWGEHLVHESMSRGQSRALLVACKLVELEYISQKGERRPVLLLDDIFSELDRERRERLFGVFGDYQVVMTTTELEDVDRLSKEKTQVINL